MSIRCAHCKGRHETVADVAACAMYGTGSVPDTSTPAPANEPPARRWYGGNGGKPWPFPSGRYAIRMPHEDRVRFFKVDCPTEGRWAGYVFLKEQAGDDLWPVKGHRGTEILDQIAEDAEGAMLLYGKEIGRCGHCGRTLTDETSRELGIGPVCRNKISF